MTTLNLTIDADGVADLPNRIIAALEAGAFTIAWRNESIGTHVILAPVSVTIDVDFVRAEFDEVQAAEEPTAAPTVKIVPLVDSAAPKTHLSPFVDVVRAFAQVTGLAPGGDEVTHLQNIVDTITAGGTMYVKKAGEFIGKEVGGRGVKQVDAEMFTRMRETFDAAQRLLSAAGYKLEWGQQAIFLEQLILAFEGKRAVIFSTAAAAAHVRTIFGV